ncbi:MAG TPA: nitrate- and nitrite sensing domain-containing protein [Actinokineospora sp.]|nr:nitrate- and nitrite sensing domain-containing protein [Actinokineospora sp.]
MILSRLGIRGKLNVLLLVPLTAVLIVAVPWVMGQIDTARSSRNTADVAGHARDFGGLVWELQRERLLTAAYLADPDADNTDLVRQHRTVDDAAATALGMIGEDGSDELSSALTRIGSLRELRQNALRHGVSADAVARTYHAVISAVIDGLRLVLQSNSDAEGTRQLTVLDSLLRANEEGELRGMAFIAAAIDPLTGRILVDNATAQSRMLTERFVEQAGADHARLVVDVAQGDAARKVDMLEGRLPVNARVRPEFVADALEAVQDQSRLRRGVQDQVTAEVTAAAAERASGAQTAAWTVGLGAALLFVLVAFLALRVSRAIADPLRRLTAAATSVADLAETELVRVADTEEAETQAVQFAAIEVSTSDEVGQLAAAFNRVQSTAAMLVERQAVTRRNVGLMFANVAQRTQNLVGRQMALVDELERDEQDVRLLERLYRLDHVSTRLRRSADNLLVVAGAQEQGRLSGPIQLSIALRSALAEIEEYQRVELGSIADLTLPAPIGSDLVLVFAELMDNATSFSPPGAPVEVSTSFTGDGSCVVSIIDHGIGMPAQKLAEENRRLVERERLDIVPTTVLGLFVIGRLARRHSLRVRLVPTEGGGITAQVIIVPELFVRPEPEPEPRPQAQPVEADAGAEIPAVPQLRIPNAAPASGFSWFPSFEGEEPDWAAMGRAEFEPEPEPAPVRSGPTVPDLVAPTVFTTPVSPSAARAQEGAVQEGRQGLRRRVAGAQLPGGVLPEPSMAAPAEPTKVVAPVEAPRHDPEAARAALDAFGSAFARASSAAESSEETTLFTMAAVRPAADPSAESRSGLTRRVAGAQVPPRAVVEPQQAPRPQEARAGLNRRVAGAQLPGTGSSVAEKPGTVPPVEPPRHDPEAARKALDAFGTAFARAGAPSTVDSVGGDLRGDLRDESRGGLSRRVPGAHLAPGLRKAGATPDVQVAATATVERRERDPEAERSALDMFTTGLARAAKATSLDAAKDGTSRREANPRRESKP